MNKTAWLFPGQASQKVGMGKDIYDEIPSAKEYFDIANEIMNNDIKSVIFEGPEETLKKTEFTQPAIYIVSVIIGKILVERGFEPDCLAGHSLGEYSAYTIGGCFDFETGLNLVKARADSMSKASSKVKGKMAAIIGMEIDALEKFLRFGNDLRILSFTKDDCNSALASLSASKMYALYFSSKYDETVLFPDAMPPVIPIIFITGYVLKFFL